MTLNRDGLLVSRRLDTFENLNKRAELLLGCRCNRDFFGRSGPRPMRISMSAAAKTVAPAIETEFMLPVIVAETEEQGRLDPDNLPG
jgi:hypothetical protein